LACPTKEKDMATAKYLDEVLRDVASYAMKDGVKPELAVEIWAGGFTSGVAHILERPETSIATKFVCQALLTELQQFRTQMEGGLVPSATD